MCQAVLRPGVRRWAVLKNSFVALYKTREDILPEATLLLDTDTVLQVGSSSWVGR